MVHQFQQGVEADAPLADLRMAILAAPQGEQGIVHVEGLEPIEANMLVELLQNAIQVVNDVVSRGEHVAGVQTDAHFVA